MFKDLKFSLDRICIKNDHDPGSQGDGEIYIKYNLDDGKDEYSGRTSIISIGDGECARLGYDWKLNDVEQTLCVNFEVWEEDSGSDDLIGKGLEECFSADENFGIGEHEWDTKDYTLEYTIFEV